MRDIKFRALTDIQTGPDEFVEGFVYGGIYIHDGICKYITTKDFDFISAKKDSIGQYTGKKDKNGVDIYEGDIVNDDLIGICQVKYSDKHAAFKVIHKNNSTAKWFVDYLPKEFKYLRVIGNIHQNHELLESK